MQFGLQWLACFGLVIMCQSGSDALAQQQSQVNEPITSIWQSVFSEDRSRQFEVLRRRRLQLIRSIDTLAGEIGEAEQRVQELSLKQAEATKLLQGMAPDEVSHDILDLRQQIRKFELENQNLDTRKEEHRERLSKDIEILETNVLNVEQRRLLNKLKLQLESLDQDYAMIEAKGALDLKGKKEKLEELERVRDARRSRQEGRAEQLKDELVRYQALITDLEKTISQKRSERIDHQVSLDSINASIIKLIEVSDSDSYFRWSTSLLFALLVAGVIWGFFRIAGSNTDVVYAIFSNDSGIQFITLFSIVIAVILFGIIGVLESKELSALLGGLSGYILGRGSALGGRRQDPAMPARPEPSARSEESAVGGPDQGRQA